MIEMDIPKKGGSLRFWGDWFGRPYDNFHRPVSAEHNGGVMTIRFDNGERLTVFEPSGIVNEQNDFHIESAGKIVWEWYYYGKERTPENLCGLEYTYNGDAVSVVCTGKYRAGARSIDTKSYALELC